MKLWVCVVLLAASATFAGCKGAAHDNAADVQALKDNETQWNADFASKDAAKIGAHYADDATLIVSGEKPTAGKAAITAAFTGMLRDPAFSLEIHTEKAVAAETGDVGFTQGSYTLTLTNPADKSVVHDFGTYLTVYRKASDGMWKAVSDAPVSSVPPAVPPAK
jgi:ketosteroid isomerase-like protein